MKEIEGNIWDYHNKGNWIVVTTNGFVKKDGTCVMGRGIAKQAASRFPELPRELGQRILGISMPYGECTQGNNLKVFQNYKIITFPTKHNWWERADIVLIEESCRSLLSATEGTPMPIYMVRPGCSNGQLDWKDVKPILEKYLDDRFIVVERNVR